MKLKTQGSKTWIWLILLFIGVFCVGGFLHYSLVDSNAQEPSQTAVEKAPEVKPAEQTKPETTPKEEPKSEAKSSEADDQSCIACHNPDILKMTKEELADQVNVGDKPAEPKKRPPFVFGDLNLSIDEAKYAESIHKDITCVGCHKDVTEAPHNQRLAPVDCKECHDDSVTSIMASAHGEKLGPKAPPCYGCHDVHYGKEQSTYDQDFKKKACLDCHKAYGIENNKVHAGLDAFSSHMKLDCMLCHRGEKPGVHNIPSGKKGVVACVKCHQRDTVLSEKKAPPVDLFTYIAQTSFINSELFQKFSYVIGAHRIPALDTLLILVVLGTFGLPLLHGGIRILTRRKGPIHVSDEKIYLHPVFERIWHWFQAVCIIMLIITGIMIHWPERFPNWFQWGIGVHNWFGWAAVISFVAWIIYVIFSGRISHYFPKKGEIPGGMIKQAKFYGYGIFKHEPHPYAPSEDNKFNPLQKIAYLQFQLLFLPLLLVSGLLYMYPDCFSGIVAAIGGLKVVAIIHLILGALFAAFLIAHMYLATTGETVSENFKAMIFGYGTKEDHHDHK